MVKKVWQTDKQTDRRTDGLNQSYSCLVAGKKRNKNHRCLSSHDIFTKLRNKCVINKYPVEIKYGVQKHDNLFLQMVYFDNYAVCNINSDDVYKIVTPCFVKIENIAKPPPLLKLNKPIVPLSPKSIKCDICTVKSPAFETTSLFYDTPTDCTSMQESLMQGHKQKLYKTRSCCGRDTCIL